MLRPPTTIKAALLAGFLLNFLLWLASAYYFTQRVREAQTRSEMIHARFLRGQELLFTVQNQTLLGALYLRDALGSASDGPAGVARDQLRALQAQAAQALAQYEATGSAVDGPTWQRLEAELRDYWETAVRMTASGAAGATGTAPPRPDAYILSKGDVVSRISDEIREVLAGDFSREARELSEVQDQARRRLGETTAVAVALGLGILVLTTWYVGGLESQIRERQELVDRNRMELQLLSGKLVRAQEDERRAVARELHDEIGQALTAVKMELAMAEHAVGADERAVAALSSARAVTEHALTTARDLSQLLRPAMLDDFGLADTLRWYLSKFSERTTVRTELVEGGLAERLPADVEVCAYRAIQEALTNVARHAHASSCRVFAQRLSSSLLVTIEDDGCGFPAPGSNVGRTTGLGLVGIRERAVGLGGTFRIQSRHGEGTRLTIELPLTTGQETPDGNGSNLSRG